MKEIAWKSCSRWEDSIKIHPRKRDSRGWTEFSWLEVGYKWRAFLHTVMNFLFP
jgi:hypothetical protein